MIFLSSIKSYWPTYLHKYILHCSVDSIRSLGQSFDLLMLTMYIYPTISALNRIVTKI
jgi:hypothetical protein